MYAMAVASFKIVPGRRGTVHQGISLMFDRLGHELLSPQVVAERAETPGKAVGARRTGPIETFIGDHRLGTPMIATTAANPIY